MFDTATQFLSMSATSASVERSFSLQGFLHTKKRNRLNHSTVKKLMNIALNASFEEDTSRGLLIGPDFDEDDDVSSS